MTQRKISIQNKLNIKKIRKPSSFIKRVLTGFERVGEQIQHPGPAPYSHSFGSKSLEPGRGPVFTKTDNQTRLHGWSVRFYPEMLFALHKKVRVHTIHTIAVHHIQKTSTRDIFYLRVLINILKKTCYMLIMNLLSFGNCNFCLINCRMTTQDTLGR